MTLVGKALPHDVATEQAEAALAFAPCLVITLDCEVLRALPGGKDEG